ncbi:MAG TPA: FHA domain-containing protein [Pyrinomonadaceae bacterium]|nr:FHA domain-containing protein [Pyrinomonadaceae bacterium]
MAHVKKKPKKRASADWFVQGILTKLGDYFDRITGRRWKPSSSLATSELGERLKALIDAEARESPEGRRYVPHNIKLKMQWDKFATDSEDVLKKLEHELMTTLIDHINDRRYLTYSSISLEVKPDYFTNGVKLFASFDKADDDEREVSLNVTVPNLTVEIPAETELAAGGTETTSLSIEYSAGGKEIRRIIDLSPGARLSIGRTGENDIPIDDASISKMHASLLIGKDGELVVADTGSTNGTFVGGERIAYGKAIPVMPEQDVVFGSVEVKFGVTYDYVPAPQGVNSDDTADEVEDVVKIGDLEFKAKPVPSETEETPLPQTEPAIGHSVTLLPLTTELNTIKGAMEIEERKDT